MSRYIDVRSYFERIGYEPHPRQWEFHLSTARFRAPVCGRRFGKSTMAGRDVQPKLLLPKRRWWIVGPTYDLAEKEFRVIWDDMLIKQGLHKDKRVKRAYNKKQGNMFIEFPWQTRVECRSADHPENLVGESLDGVIMSEAAKHKKDTWERYMRAALSDRRGEAMFPTTPEGMNWLHQIWQYGQNPDMPDYHSWQFPSWENPAVFPGGRDDPEILLVESSTAPEWFRQEYGADFTAFVGKIYGMWQEKTHVRKVTFNPAWRNYIAFDWGYAAPLAAIEFQIDPLGRCHVWREHYLARTMLPDHIRMLKEREQPEGYHLDLAFGDAADPEAAEYVSINLVGCIALPDAKKNWREGIDEMNKYLKVQETGSYDEYERPLEEPSLFVDHSCTNTIREFNNYRTPDTASDKNPREAAKPFDDHALDALRYGLMHIKLGAGSQLAAVYSGMSDGERAGVMGLMLPDEGGSGLFDNFESGFFTQGGEF